MTGRLSAGLAVAVSVLLGVFLRLFRWDVLPPGPWIDEALVLRAARAVAADPAASLFGMTPLLPPEAGFQNAWVPNLYLRLASLVDALAGGGMASIRALSIGPSLVLLAGVVLIAGEAGRGRPQVGPAGAFLAATSMWLLTTARWGWNAVFAAAALVLAAWAALVAARRRALAWSLLAGALLGLSLYGYQAARLAVAVPPAALAYFLLRRRRDAGAAAHIRLAAGALLAAAAVAGPLFVAAVRHPERVFARERSLSVLSLPPAAAVRGLGRNVADYGALFLVGGDRNERHGDPARPVLPAPVLGFAFVGAGVAVRRSRPERLLALLAGVLLLGGLLAVGEAGANAYRISAAAPFLLVLAACGLSALLSAVPETHRRAAGLAALGLVLFSGLSEAAAFLSWGASPRTWGAFGGPERELADAIAGERAAGDVVPVLLAPGAARNADVVDALLGHPGDGGRRTTRTVGLLDAGVLARLPSAVLVADGGALLGVQGSKGRVRLLARGTDPWGEPTFFLYRVSPGPAP